MRGGGPSSPRPSSPTALPPTGRRGGFSVEGFRLRVCSPPARGLEAEAQSVGRRRLRGQREARPSQGWHPVDSSPSAQAGRLPAQLGRRLAAVGRPPAHLGPRLAGVGRSIRDPGRPTCRLGGRGCSPGGSAFFPREGASQAPGCPGEVGRPERDAPLGRQSPGELPFSGGHSPFLSAARPFEMPPNSAAPGTPMRGDGAFMVQCEYLFAWL
jgi:hypothetical protein